MLTYVLAVLAACANATSSALQRKANRRAPRRENMSLRLIWSLAHEPVWFGGILAVTVGMFLVQSAMNAGRLIAAQPGLPLSDPIVSILWGVLVFGERVRDGWYVALAVVSGLVMAAPLVVLARSPLLSDESARQEEEPRPVREGKG